MSDDLIERLRQGPVRIIEHYTSCSAEEVDGVENTMTEAADEISRLRAEVERLTAERDEADRIATLRGNHIEFRLLPQMMDLESALADERRHADALAEALGRAENGFGKDSAMMSDDEWTDGSTGIRAALAQHRARRQG